MAGVFRLHSAVLRRLLPQLNRRLISTSKKNSESVVTDTAECASKVTKRNWISYGFDKNSEAADLNSMHSVLFASVTVCLVFGAFVIGYAPDYSLHDWAQREAFLELRRREDAGLPFVDPNLIDPKKIQLPSDEEIGDAEIII